MKKTRSITLSFLLLAYFFSYAGTIDNTYDLVYHRISFGVNPGTSAAINNGSVTSYFKTTVPSFSTIQFDLDYSRMTVSSVVYHGSSISFSKIAPATISISIPTIDVAGTLDSITVNYSGTPLIASTSGVPSGYNYQPHNSQYAIYTLGEAFTGHYWWPCKESLFDKIDSVDLIVTAPSSYKVAGNGLVTEEVSGTNIITTWKTRYAIATYGINFAVANYKNYQYTITVNNKSLPLLNYFYSENYNGYKAYADSLKSLIPAYSNLLNVPYPFINEKYGFADCAGGNWGALEVQSMTFMSTQSFTDSGYTMAHELAHQWFGDMVTTNSWHQIWLNEGFAQYFQQVIYPELIKPRSLYYQRSNLKSKVTSASTVYVPDTSSANTIFIPSSSISQPYEKGAMLLSMLRTWVGDNGFFTALHNYLTAPGVQYGFTSVDTLKKYMQEQTPLNLNNFFNDWVNKKGYANYTIKWALSGKKITISLIQAPTVSSAGYFEMPVPIRIRNTTTGLDTTVVVIDKRGVLYYSGADPGSGNNSISYNLSSVANNVSFDPDNMVLGSAPTITNDNTILPVLKLDFDAENYDTRGVKLKWSIISDERINSVTLEKSANGISFADLYESLNSPGNSKNISGGYMDNNVALKEFYRLKITGASNHILYSSIKSIISQQSLGIDIFPNPAVSTVNLSIPSGIGPGNITVSIRNIYGQLIREIVYSGTVNNTIAFTVTDWKPGTYLISLIKNKELIMQKSLLKL